MIYKNKTSGFTIVELLIVIVVIAILAAITIVAYNSIQAKSRDAARRSDLATIAKALKLNETQNGTFLESGSGCGSNGNGQGWFSYEGTSSYPVSMANCLVNANVINKALADPSGSRSCSGLSCRAYMKYNCTQDGQVVSYVYANLETLPQTETDTDSTCQSTLDTQYGMNYFVKVSR